MSEKIHTREFCISDYHAALQLWQRVEGLEIAEGFGCAFASRAAIIIKTQSANLHFIIVTNAESTLVFRPDVLGPS